MYISYVLVVLRKFSYICNWVHNFYVFLFFIIIIRPLYNMMTFNIFDELIYSKKILSQKSNPTQKIRENF